MKQKSIEHMITLSEWSSARKLINKALKKDPRNHWLLTRLSLTYYEERDYSKALEYVEVAARLAPDCPLVLWDHAGTLDMLGRHQEAIQLYQRLIDLGIDSLAHDPCGEGVARATALYVDSLYRLARCYEEVGDKPQAARWIDESISLRTKTTQSIYSLEEVSRVQRRLR